MPNFFSALGFKGRIGRGRYWLLTGLYLLTLIVGLVAFAVTGAMLDAHPGDTITLGMVPIGIIFILGMTIAIAGAGVRRLHDRGKTGFWLALYYGAPLWLSNHAYFDLVGYVSLTLALGVFIWTLVDLGVLPGDPGSNRFGPSPVATRLEPQTS
jgi:uncharacterized membrane protein YhaH (DUF805 family)